MPSQRKGGSKASQGTPTLADKFKAALSAPSAELAEALEPFKKSLDDDQRKVIAGQKSLLNAWVSRMKKELKASNYEGLYNLMVTGDMQIVDSFLDQPQQLKSSGLVALVGDVLNTVGPLYNAEPKAVAAALGLAEQIVEDLELRGELFGTIVKQVMAMGTSHEVMASHRRTCLSILLSGIHRSQENKDMLDLPVLSTYLLESDDFACQQFIAAILGKLLTSKPRTEDRIAKKRELVKQIAGVMGEENTKKLEKMVHENNADGHTEFVLLLNSSNPSRRVHTLPCSELQLGKDKFSEGEGGKIMLHCNATTLTFNLPAVDDELETIDIPITGMSKIEIAKSGLTIIFKASNVPAELARYVTADTFTMVVKATDVQPWAQCVSQAVKKAKGLGADEAVPRKSKATSHATSASKATKRVVDEEPSVADEEVYPVPKKSKQARDTTDSGERRTRSKIAETITPSHKEKLSDMLKLAMGDDDTVADSRVTRTPRLSIDLPTRKTLDAPSPFHKDYKLQQPEMEEDATDTDLDTVFSQLRQQFAQSAMRKQQKGREGLEKTMEMVQNLVDEFKQGSAKRDEKLAQHLDAHRGELERVEKEMHTVFLREKQLSKEIEQLHNQFIMKGKEARDTTQACFAEIEEIAPRVKEQEQKALGKLKEMVDTEFSKLEEQVMKIQSQKSMMAKMMKFMMAQLSSAEDE